MNKRFIAYPIANYWGIWDTELRGLVSPFHLKFPTETEASEVAERYNAKYEH